MAIRIGPPKLLRSPQSTTIKAPDTSQKPAQPAQPPPLPQPMVTSGSVTAPADAAAVAGYSDNMPAFFSTGRGSAKMYTFSTSGGVGQEDQASEEGP